eukprot:jgi/Tetstr1/432362/TSEL_021759.t1
MAGGDKLHGLLHYRDLATGDMVQRLRGSGARYEEVIIGIETPDDGAGSAARSGGMVFCWKGARHWGKTDNRRHRERRLDTMDASGASGS